MEKRGEIKGSTKGKKEGELMAKIKEGESKTKIIMKRELREIVLRLGFVSFSNRQHEEFVMHFCFNPMHTTCTSAWETEPCLAPLGFH